MTTLEMDNDHTVFDLDTPDDLALALWQIARREGRVEEVAELAYASLPDKVAEAKAEADYGYSGTFKDEEYNDPAPRWREALIRALGLLGADAHTQALLRWATPTARMPMIRPPGVPARIR